MKAIVILLTILVSHNFLCAEDYYFLASKDNLYENPENWFPSYPGTKIGKNDRIVIYSDVYLADFHLHVSGKLEIRLGCSINSSRGIIYIQPGGALSNCGKLYVNALENHGAVYNEVAGEILINEYVAHDGAITQNALSAKFTTLGNLTNYGRFDNYSYCMAGSDFENRAIFNQNHTSKLMVTGKILLRPGSILNRSQNSRIIRKETEANIE